MGLASSISSSLWRQHEAEIQLSHVITTTTTTTTCGLGSWVAVTRQYKYRYCDYSSPTCHPGCSGWPVYEPVGPSDWFWSESSSTSSSTSPDWRSICPVTETTQFNIYHQQVLRHLCDELRFWCWSVCRGGYGTICWMRWKLLPWKLNACSNRTLSSTVHSSGNGVKFGRSARDFSMLCLCQKSMPSAWRHTHTHTYCLHHVYAPNCPHEA